MIRNYFVIAWRSLIKNRLFSTINIFGLALAMSVGMMVMIRVMDSFSYDGFHPAPDRTFRITSHITNAEKASWQLASTPLPLQQILSDNASVFSSSVSFYPAIHESVTDGVKDLIFSGTFVQSSLFEVFGFTLLHGNETSALQEPFSVVLSHAAAEKFFGTDNPLGKLLTFEKLGAFQVTGVLDKPSGKSHIRYDVFVSFSTVEKLETGHKLPVKSTNWDSFENAYTYVVLSQNSSAINMNDRLEQVAAGIRKDSNTGELRFIAQPLSAISPSWGTLYNDNARVASWGKIIVEISVAFIILLAASFNYTNLSIARALTRTREVGIRKVAGARRSQIFFQYIVESVVVSFFALIAGSAILSLILEYKPFNDGYEFVPDVSIDWLLILSFTGFALFAGLLAGIIPSWILSSFKAIKMLRNNAVEKIMGAMTLRKVLLVFQFSISLVVLIFLTAFYKQFSFMENADQGFETKNILSVPLLLREDDPFKTEITRLAGVEQVGSLSTLFGEHPTGTADVRLKRESQQGLRIGYYFCDNGAISIHDLKLIAGKGFGNQSSSRIEQFVILNKKATEVFGFKNVSDAIGESIWLDSVQLTITGVVGNFYHEGVGIPVAPLALRNKNFFHHLLVKVNPTASAQIASQVEQAWKKIYPGRPFESSWLGQDHEQRYDQSATISLLGFLAFMTVTIASLGLLGLVVYTVETRRKEISIRKIVGSSVPGLIALLSKGFATLLIIAGIIAVPLGYFLSKLFLTNFATRVDFGIGTSLFSLGFLLIVGLSMIISQTFKAAIENPVKNLRSE